MSELEQFAGAGADAGTHLWRIEDFEPVKQDFPAKAEDIESITLFSGDSYILLHSYKANQFTQTLKHDLFFWLGAESTADERGSAAYHTVCLDDSIGGIPVQYRETQGHESERFLKLVKRVQYMEGGVPSGFTSVADLKKTATTLYQVKGHPRFRSVAPIVTSVPPKAASVNHSDSFILVPASGREVYVWHGESALPQEKFAASQFAASLLRATKVVEGDDPAFFEHLEGGFGDVQEDASEAEDEAHLAEHAPVKYTAGSGSFLLDGGAHVYVFMGERGDREETKQMMLKIEAFLAERPGAETVYLRKENADSEAHFQDLLSKVKEEKEL